MTHFEELSENLQELVSPRKTKFGELGKDLTCSVDGSLFFITNVFKDGNLLGFWSHSPWGTCHDQEQGWVVLSPDLEMKDLCETRTGGRSAGNDFLTWRSRQISIHGKTRRLMPEWGGEQFWKISET